MISKGRIITIVAVLAILFAINRVQVVSDFFYGESA